MERKIVVKRVVFWVIAALLAAFAIASIIGIQFEINDRQEQKEALEAEKEALVAENERMEHDISMPVGDEYIIAIMRKLGYRFPGEDKITFDTEETSADEG